MAKKVVDDMKHASEAVPFFEQCLLATAIGPGEPQDFVISDKEEREEILNPPGLCTSWSSPSMGDGGV